MNLFTHRARSCHEAGICQRLGPECRRECHQAPAWQGDPPIGYEAAHTAAVHQLHREAQPAHKRVTTPMVRIHSDKSNNPFHAAPCTAEVKPAYEWEWLEKLMAKVSAYFLAVLLALALVGWVLTTWRSWNTCADSGWLADLCWAIYDLHG